MMPDAGGGRRPSREDARALVEASRSLTAEITDLLAGLPFAQPPAVADVQRALPDPDLSCLHLPQPGAPGVDLVYLDTLVDGQRLWQEVVQPLVSGTLRPDSLPRAQPLRSLVELRHRLLLGWAVILQPAGPPLGIAMAGVLQRSVGEPTTEREIIGPKEGFVENFQHNLGLIRNRLRDPSLRIEYLTVGRRSRTRVAMLYLVDVARPSMVRRTRAGLRGIAIDFVRTAMDVAELTFQHSWAVFPLVEQTERPDRVAREISLGRLALVVEGTPFVLLVPVTFFDLQHDGEGALPGPGVTLFVRMLRLSGLFLALALPGLYAAVLGANPLVMPVPLTITLAAARFAIPYPVATEVLLMMLIADILAQATAQSASGIGNALSIVGTLIVGQLMVQAHLASTLLMIVVAASLTGSFLTLKFPLSYALRIWKYALVLLAGVAGLLGWFIGILVMVVHLASLESAGVPYLSPLAAAASPRAVARAVVEPGRGNIRLRPAEYQPQQAVAARRRGRR